MVFPTHRLYLGISTVAHDIHLRENDAISDQLTSGQSALALHLPFTDICKCFEGKHREREREGEALWYYIPSVNTLRPLVFNEGLLTGLFSTSL